MSVLSGLLQGINEGVEKQRQEKNKRADIEAENAKARGMEILKGIIGGDIEETQDPQEATMTEPGQIIKRGLFGKAETAPGRMYKRGNNVEKQLKEENLKYMQGVNREMTDETGGQGNLVYRDIRTGEEISPEIAQEDIKTENKKYIISRKEITRSGIKETPLIKETNVKIKSMPSSKQKVIDDLISGIGILDQISQKSQTGKYKTGYMSAYSQTSPFHKARMSLRGKPEEAAFKADLTDAQAAYASARTGAQRGFKEIAWLESAMPSGDTPPEQLSALSSRARERLELNLRNALLSAQKTGIDVSQYEDNINDLLDAYPIEKYQFGIKQDGTKQGSIKSKYADLGLE